MDLKRLLNEVETARTGIHIRHVERMVRDLDRYENELMPDLARRLKKAVDTLERLRGVVYPSDISKACNSALLEIENPPTLRERIRETPGYVEPYVPVTQKPPERCPKCTYTMLRSERSNGWYCRADFLFIPDECL